MTKREMNLGFMSMRHASLPDRVAAAASAGFNGISLRADQWADNHPEAPAAQRAAIKRALRDAFYVDDEGWKQQVLAQGVQAAHQGVAGLGSAAAVAGR